MKTLLAILDGTRWVCVYAVLLALNGMMVTILLLPGAPIQKMYESIDWNTFNNQWGGALAGTVILLTVPILVVGCVYFSARSLEGEARKELLDKLLAGTCLKELRVSKTRWKIFGATQTLLMLLVFALVYFTCVFIGMVAPATYPFVFNGYYH